MIDTNGSIEKDGEHKIPGDKIHIFANQDTPGDSVLPIRWCICPEVLEELKEKNIENPMVLLVIVQDKKEIERRLVPLDRIMEYIAFRRPGLHKIMATIVYGDGGEIPRIKSILLEKENAYSYLNYILDEEGNFRNNWISNFPCINQIGSAELEVNVDERYFAKEPPEWRKKWVNFWYETKPVDECQYRKRGILAFTIQPLAVLLHMAVLFLARIVISFVLVLCGIRNLDFKPLIHLFNLDTNDIWWKNKGSVFIKNAEGESRSPILWAFMPIVPLSLLIISYVIRYFFFQEWEIQWVFIAVAGVIGIWVVLVAVILVIMKISDTISIWRYQRKTRTLSPEEIKKREEEQARKDKEAENDELNQINELQKAYDRLSSAIVCPGTPLNADLKALPKERRTIYLRFYKLKSKVCKPFKR